MKRSGYRFEQIICIYIYIYIFFACFVPLLTFSLTSITGDRGISLRQLKKRTLFVPFERLLAVRSNLSLPSLFHSTEPLRDALIRIIEACRARLVSRIRTTGCSPPAILRGNEFVKCFPRERWNCWKSSSQSATSFSREKERERVLYLVLDLIKSRKLIIGVEFIQWESCIL